MRNLGRASLTDFLLAVDAELRAPCEIIVVGGAVIGLRYKGTHFTSDLDVWAAVPADLASAIERVNEQRKPNVPVQAVTIGDAPRDFEDRLEHLELRGLSKLGVWVPEAHDLAIMKLARGAAHDLDAIEDIHRSSPIELPTLLDRYRQTDFVGDLSTHRLTFLAVVARLFGEEQAEKLFLRV